MGAKQEVMYFSCNIDNRVKYQEKRCDCSKDVEKPRSFPESPSWQDFKARLTVDLSAMF